MAPAVICRGVPFYFPLEILIPGDLALAQFLPAVGRQPAHCQSACVTAGRQVIGLWAARSVLFPYSSTLADENISYLMYRFNFILQMEFAAEVRDMHIHRSCVWVGLCFPYIAQQFLPGNDLSAVKLEVVQQSLLDFC